MNELFYKNAQAILKEDKILAISKIVSSSGSTPGKKGHIMLVRKDGRYIGSTGGGLLELQNIKDCKELIADFVRETTKSCSSIIRKKYNLSLDKDADLKMACTGEVEVEYQVFKSDCKELEEFLNLNESNPRLVIFGAGHVCQALVPLAKGLGFVVVICDDREIFLNKETHAQADEFCCVDYKDFTKSFSLKEKDYVLIMTQGHLGDIDILKSLKDFYSKLSYIGVIGSDKKIAIAKDELRSVKADEKMLDFIHGPVGFKVGGKSSFEIAISIACELIAVKYGYR